MRRSVRLMVLAATLGLVDLAHPAAAEGLFMTQMKLLKEKTRQCDVEMNTKKEVGGFCKDYEDYSNFVFKGSVSSYMEYHLSNGDITDKNSDYVLSVLKLAVATTKRSMSMPHSQGF